MSGTRDLATELRRAFDEAFARPLLAPTEETSPFLLFALEGDVMAASMKEIAGIERCRRLTALPSPSRELLGIAGLRGSLLPVYSLRLLLGYPEDSPHPPRWILLPAGAASVGLALDDFRGQLRVLPSRLSRLSDVDPARPHVTAVIREEETAIPVVSIVSIIEAIRKIPSG